VTYPDSTTQAYTYDAVGNRQTKVQGATTSYSYDVADRMTAAGADTYGYDKSGNQATRTSGATTTRYCYDALDRLTNTTDQPSCPFAPVRVNAGGGLFTDASGRRWDADAGFGGGATDATTAAIANTVDDALYQNYRYSTGTIGYAHGVPNGTYSVTLKFSEPTVTAAGQRLFDVGIEGALVLDDFDVFAAAGARNTAVDRTFQATVADGTLDVAFTTGVRSGIVSAIEVTRVGEPASPASVRLNVGSTAAHLDEAGQLWVADAYSSGGTTASTTAAIANTAEDAMYRRTRTGTFSYAIPVTNGPHVVTLKFSENTVTAAGQRKFDVAVEGTTVLDDFDVFAAAGGKNVALDRSFTTTVTDSTLDLAFTTVVNGATVSAIEVEPVGAPTWATATQTYRADGLRHSKTAGGATTTYTWDVNVGLPVVLQDGTSTYVYGLGGSLVSQTNGAGAQTYMLSDGLGSTRALTDATGTVTATYDYDAFGALRASTGTGATEYRFTGQEEDAALGYQYLRARYYDVATGRFISRDLWPESPATRRHFIATPTSTTTQPISLTPLGCVRRTVGDGGC
jgi:RHS repeat-associated protein